MVKLTLSTHKWSVGFPAAMISFKDAEKIGIRAGNRLIVKSLKKNAKSLVVRVQLSQDLASKKIALSLEARKILGSKKDQSFEVGLSKTQESLNLIKKKLADKKLTKKEIDKIIEDVVKNSLSDPEVALFIAAMAEHGMSFEETVGLIKAILKTGSKLSFKKRLIADKHSIGGIAGRTTPLVVSICAAAGLTMPKTSSRAITSAAGTADIMETVASIDFVAKDLQKIVDKVGACIVWGGGLGLVPADSKIIKVEKALNIDPEAQLLASIMSKKLAVGSNYIIIDIPYGKSAKVDRKKAQHLKRKFEHLGKYFHKKLRCNLSLNNGPLGDGVGPVLELIDVLRVLKRESSCHNIEKRSLEIAGDLLELTGKAKRGKGIALATTMLESGKAYKKFREIIKAQKGSLVIRKLPAHKRTILSTKTGFVRHVDNKKTNALARSAGCPEAKGAGIFFHRHEGKKVKKGEPLFTIYAESPSRLKKAQEFAKKNLLFEIQ